MHKVTLTDTELCQIAQALREKAERDLERHTELTGSAPMARLARQFHDQATTANALADRLDEEVAS